MQGMSQTQSNRPRPAGSKSTNPLGITEIAGRDGRTIVVSNISHAMSDVAHVTMLPKCVSKVKYFLTKSL